MRITFVALGWERLGLSLLSSIAKQYGHRTSLAFSPSLFNDRYNLNVPLLSSLFDDRRDLMAEIFRQRPDVIVFSPLTGTYQWALSVARETKAMFPSVAAVFGGVHVSAVPDLVLAQPEVDYVCIGEGDVAFPAILRAIEGGWPKVPIVNTRYKTIDGSVVCGPQGAFFEDLDALPVVDKTLWEEHINIGDWYLTMTSRGCPYRCSYCFNSFFAQLHGAKGGKYVRRRSVAHVMRELRWAQKRYHLRFLEFEDDVFTADKKWLKTFLSLYKKEIGVPFQCLTHSRFMDDDVARWLADAGCRYVQMGIQSMDEAYKARVIKRYESEEHIDRAMGAMRKHGIAVKVDHMFGLPGEPLEAQEAARRLYVRHPPFRIQTFWTNYFPGTEMALQAHQDGVINSDELDRLNNGVDLDFYRDSSKGIGPQNRRAYKAYEALFKLIPVLPDGLRRKLDRRAFERLPLPVCSVISFLADAFAGLMKGNPDHWLYAKHYLYHIMRFCMKQVGVKTAPATRLKDNWPVPGAPAAKDFRRAVHETFLEEVTAGSV